MTREDKVFHFQGFFQISGSTTRLRGAEMSQPGHPDDSQSTLMLDIYYLNCFSESEHTLYQSFNLR